MHSYAHELPPECRQHRSMRFWMGGGGWVVVGDWNSDSLTYQGWKFQAYLSPVPGGPWELGEVGIGGMCRKIMRK